MCDFKPGDEVVCINDAAWSPQTFQPRKGQIYTVSEVVIDCGRLGIGLCEANDADELFAPKHFRKVQRRDLSAWLKTGDDFEEPKRAPAKERV